MTNIIQAFLDKPKLLNTNYVSNPKLAKRFKVPLESILQAKKIAIKTLNEKNSLDLTSAIESISTNIEKGVSEIKFHHTSEVLEEEEIWKETKMDKSKWKFVQVYHKKFGKGFLYTANFRAREEGDIEVISQKLTDFLEGYKFDYKPISKADILINEVFTKPSCLLISMADFHLDKRTIDGKSIYEKVDIYHKIVNNLLFQAYRTHLLDEIIYVTSNDLLHVDNYQEGTTALTPQQCSTTWYNSYEIAFDLQAKTINKLKQFCEKLTIVHVPSNHARTKEYYLMHGLSVMFSSDPNILFDRTAESTKCVTYGNTFIGMHHGDVKDYNQLPSYFASKFRKQWGDCKFSEIALADKHHRKEWKHSLTKNEVHGTRMFICPSLSGEDIWHKDKLYDLSIKASIARIYDKEKGFCTEFEERIM